MHRINNYGSCCTFSEVYHFYNLSQFKQLFRKRRGSKHDEVLWNATSSKLVLRLQYFWSIHTANLLTDIVDHFVLVCVWVHASMRAQKRNNVWGTYSGTNPGSFHQYRHQYFIKGVVHKRTVSIYQRPNAAGSPRGQVTSVTSGLQGLSCRLFFSVLQVRTIQGLSTSRPAMRHRTVTTGGSWSDGRRTMWGM